MNLNFSLTYKKENLSLEVSYDGDCHKTFTRASNIDSHTDTVKETLVASLKLAKLVSDDPIIDSTQSFINNSFYTGYLDYIGDVSKVITNEEGSHLKKAVRGTKVCGKALGYIAKGLERITKSVIQETGIDQPYLNSFASGLTFSSSTLSVANFSLKVATAVQEMHKNGLSFTEGVNAIAATSKAYLILAPLLVTNPPMLSVASTVSSMATIASTGLKIQNCLSKPKTLTEEEELEKEYHFCIDNPIIDPNLV